jgi:hypothetical protein
MSWCITFANFNNLLGFQSGGTVSFAECYPALALRICGVDGRSSFK